MDAKWLTDLEKKVGLAIAELQKLRQENATQKSRIATLEKDLSQAQAVGDSASEWEAQREDVRQRVEKLSTELEKLL